MFSQNGCRRPLWITENHFRSHFSPFQTNTQLFCYIYFFSKWPLTAISEVRFGSFWMTENHVRSHFDRISRGHFVFTIYAKNHRILVICDLKSGYGYGEYEFDWCICDKVMACTSVGVRRRNQKHNTREIIKFRGYNYSIHALDANTKAPPPHQKVEFYAVYTVLHSFFPPQVTCGGREYAFIFTDI